MPPTPSPDAPTATPSLPPIARLPINHCNLPAVILGSLTFQKHPAPLLLDGVAELHAELFRFLDPLETSEERAHVFTEYLKGHFFLDTLEEAGLDRRRHKRGKADYLRTVRGWSFDPDGREAAVLKGWVESRFGLLPRFHGEPITDAESEAYRRYMEARAKGLYNTNALEAQLDLLFAFCQYELARRHPHASHLPLYRGVNRLEEHEVLGTPSKRSRILLLNNLTSFTANRERAGEFGDYILTCAVPLTKVFFFTHLLPGLLKGEEEYAVIGGVYEVTVATH